MIKTKVAFLEGRLFSSQSDLFENFSNWAGFFTANQRFLKTFQIALIGWINAGPPKKPLLF